MYNFKKLIIGIAPTRRDIFPPAVNARAHKIPVMARINEIFSKIPDVEIVDLEGVTEEGMLTWRKDVEKVVDHFVAKKIDALFVPHINFGQEEAVGQLCKALNVPVLLWGPRDPMPPADPREERQYDVQCGLFATSRALTRYRVPFTYVENCWLDAPLLEEEIKKFVRVASVVKAFRHARIAQISVRPWQFLSVKVNEGELMERFGIEIVPIEGSKLIAIIKDIMENREADCRKLIAEWEAKVSMAEVPDDRKVRMAAAELGLMQVAEDHGCNVIASDCWAVYDTLNIKPCFIFGDLADHGLPCACETDIHGAITQLLLSAATRMETPVFLADVTIRHPENDNAELFWHCGPFPKSLAKPGSEPCVLGCHGQYQLKDGDITWCRFDADGGNYSLFSGEGHTVDGPATNGNYVWFEASNWPEWERRLMYGPYIHHMVGAYGKYNEIMREACRYMNVAPDIFE